jgi:hypothetical protein
LLLEEGFGSLREVLRRYVFLVSSDESLDTDDSFSFTFTEPGTYEYFCSLHRASASPTTPRNKSHAPCASTTVRNVALGAGRIAGTYAAADARQVVSRIDGDTSDVFRIIRVETDDVVKDVSPRPSPGSSCRCTVSLA